MARMTKERVTTEKGSATPADEHTATQKVWKTPSFDLDQDLYRDLNRLVAYNKIMRREPATVTGVLTEAITDLFEFLDIRMEDIMALKAPSEAYQKRIASLAEDFTGIYSKKSFSVSTDLFDNVQRVIGYNSMFELPLRKASSLYRIALRRYLENLDYDFRPPAS